MNNQVFSVFLTLVLSTALLIRIASATHATSQCVQLGHANSNLCNHKRYNTTIRPGPWTIGTRKFDIKYNFLDFSYWSFSTVKNQNVACDPSNGYPINSGQSYRFIHPCVANSIVQMKVFAVKQDGNIMNGWLHIQFKLMDWQDEIIAIYVQMRDEYFNAIGEFITNSNEQCGSADQALAQPSEFQVLPCSAVGLREAKVSTALYMVQAHALRNRGAGERYLSKKNVARGIHFTWRMSEYWCNRKLRIRPEAIIITNKVVWKQSSISFSKYREPFIYRVMPQYWLHHDFFGAADIKLPLTKMRCDEEVADFNNGRMRKYGDGSRVAPWLLDKTTRSMLFNDYFNPNGFDPNTKTGGWYHQPTPTSTGIEQVGTILGCQVNTRSNYPGRVGDNWFTGVLGECDTPAADTIVTFGGRCSEHYKKFVSHNTPQGCNLDYNSAEFQPILSKYGRNMMTYSSFIKVLHINRTRLCQHKCQIPTKENISDIVKFVDNSSETGFTIITRIYNSSRLESRIEKFLTGRRYHGVLCAYWTFLLLPVSLFCARYLKETCMRVDCMGAHFWFWIHIGTSLLSVAIFVSSLTALWLIISIWGRSLHSAGTAHRYLGYTAATLYLLMLLLGSLRQTNIKIRLITMTLHSVMGFLIYFCNLAAMLTAAYIPASPAMLDCDAEGNATGPSVPFWLTIFWILLEIMVHTAMTILQCYKDRKVGVKRFWLCPVVPVLPYDSATDFIGSSIRKIILMIYAATGFLMASTMAGLIQNAQLSEECQKRTGPLSCQSVWGCSTAAKIILDRINNPQNYSGQYIGNSSNL